MTGELNGSWQIVLRSRHDARIVGHYEAYDPRCRWTTDPKRSLRFSTRAEAETIAADLRRSSPCGTSTMDVEPA